MVRNESILFSTLRQDLKGDVLDDIISRSLFATDASEYRILPVAVIYPKDEQDIQNILLFAKRNNLSIIPRTAGTSLAGQSVGKGIVMDTSRYMNQILEINVKERFAWVQPGVIRDDLNALLKKHGLFFSPITSTSNRAMIGGMVGNNSSGTTSIKYGVTRDKVLELSTVLSDGSLANFKSLNHQEFESKMNQSNLEGMIYRKISELLSLGENRKVILENFPKHTIHRRNTGYALDSLVRSNFFDKENHQINLCDLLSGSEGTLSVFTAIKIKLDPLPPKMGKILIAHFNNLRHCFKAAPIIMKQSPFACEMMDKNILVCTKKHPTYKDYRWFIQGSPEAVIAIECRADNHEDLDSKIKSIQNELDDHQLSYDCSIIDQKDANKLWQLRSAGLGLLANLSKTKRAIACIEDTAVDLEDLEDYLHEFDLLMEKHGQKSVYYAHIGAGELHLRPVLDLKDDKDLEDFKSITNKVALLVKKYKGSLSGEHGDGRVRSPFIKMVIGSECYKFLEQIKNTWDPDSILNPNIITSALPIDSHLREHSLIDIQHPPSVMYWEDDSSMLSMASKCNGSGDCRKTSMQNGTMCPSYHASLDEYYTTRARANLVREFYTQKKDINTIPETEVKKILQHCLSCKGCKAECPSNVDLSKIKAEFLYAWNKKYGMNLSSKIFARFTNTIPKSFILRKGINKLMTTTYTSKIIKKVLNIHPRRNLPLLSKSIKSHLNNAANVSKGGRKVYLFLDEFTESFDYDIGISTYDLLNRLGYQVMIHPFEESGRGAISVGDLDYAKKVANHNIGLLQNINPYPIIGMEPSAILTFRDEYPSLVPPEKRKLALAISHRSYTIEEFLQHEIKNNNIHKSQFTDAPKKIIFHSHCHQKALSNNNPSLEILNFPKNYEAIEIPSGCCGMAGSYGYQNENYEISQKIGNLKLYPFIANHQDYTLVASGHSCRHQILDKTQKMPLHTAQLLLQALK